MIVYRPRAGTGPAQVLFFIKQSRRPIKLEKYSFFEKTSSFLVKTKVVELEILYKTGVTRPSNSLSNDSLCPKYFFNNIKKSDFFKVFFFLSSGALDKSPGVFFDAEFDFNGPGTPGAIE